MDKGLTGGLRGVQGHLNTDDVLSVRCAKLLSNQTKTRKFTGVEGNPAYYWIKNQVINEQICGSRAHVGFTEAQNAKYNE